MNKCKSCIYYGEYHDPKFAPLPICLKYSNLVEASEAVKNSDKCPYNEKRSIKDAFTEVTNTFNEATEAIKKFKDTLKEVNINKPTEAPTNELMVDIKGKKVPLSKLPCWECPWRYSIHCPKCVWNGSGEFQVY